MSEYIVFAKRVSLIGVVKFISSLRGLILLPILAKNLGVANYGIWSQISVTVGLLTPFLMLNIDQLFLIFGFFLMILIGLELLESIKTYLTEDKIHVEVLFTIALIAVARKVITLEITKLPDLTIMGIAALIISLSVGYFLIKKSHQNTKQ